MISWTLACSVWSFDSFDIERHLNLDILIWKYFCGPKDYDLQLLHDR